MAQKLQFEPITNFIPEPTDMLEKVADSPVVLTDEAEGAVAVVLTYKDWRKLNEHIALLELGLSVVDWTK
ncbi:MAG: hypothetical protein AAF639_47085 [Chloroflexota bacterium]